MSKFISTTSLDPCVVTDMKKHKKLWLIYSISLNIMRESKRERERERVDQAPWKLKEEGRLMLKNPKTSS